MANALGQVQRELHSVQAIQANASAFAALRQDGTVVTWGDAEAGGVKNNRLNRLLD